MSYDFSTLNDKDLEELALDLLNTELNLGLQSFKVGKDGGVDLRYSSPENNNEIIVQVKHYLKTGESKLIKNFKETELPKVKHEISAFVESIKVEKTIDVDIVIPEKGSRISITLDSIVDNNIKKQLMENFPNSIYNGDYNVLYNNSSNLELFPIGI